MSHANLKTVLAAGSLALAASVNAALPTGFNSRIVFDKADMVSSCPLPDGRVLAVEKHGKITVIAKDGTKTLALDHEAKTQSSYEGGMCMAMAHPDFLTNGYLYIQYGKKNAVGTTVHDWVSRFTMNGNTIDPASEKKILDLGAYGPNYHHGCGLDVSPKDGMLYIGSGSRHGGGDNAAGQDAAADKTQLEGKIMRVKLPDGEIPTDNPFYATNTGDAKAVYYYGVRNPFTMSFHATNGTLWFSDVQPSNGDDEVNEGGPAGTGYGYGGGGSKGPLFDAGGASCAGGALVGSLWYTGSNFPAQYKDKYFFGQVRGCGSALKMSDASKAISTFGTFTGNGNYSPIDVKMDAGGAIYVSTRYQTENVRATAGQVIKVWYGDEPTGVFEAQHMPAVFAASKMKWTARPGALSVETLADGDQVVQLQGLDGKVIAERSVSGRDHVEFPATRGVHILTWKSGKLSAVAKVVL